MYSKTGATPTGERPSSALASPSSSSPPPRRSNNPFATHSSGAHSPTNPFTSQAEVRYPEQPTSELWVGAGAGAARWEETGGWEAGRTSEGGDGALRFQEGDGSNPWGDAVGSGVEGAPSPTPPRQQQQSPLARTPSAPFGSPSRAGEPSPGAGTSSYGNMQSSDPAPPLPRRPSALSEPFINAPNLPPRLPPRLEQQHTATSSGPFTSLDLRPDFPPAGLSNAGVSAKGKEVANADARPQHSQQAPTSPTRGEEGPEFDSFDLATRDIIRTAMDELIKAHKDELFLHRLATPASSAPQSTSSPPISSQSNDSATEHDPATESFMTAFPSLSRSPSPAPAPPPLASVSSPQSAAESSAFEEKTHRMTGLLLWQLKRLVEDEVEKGNQTWQDEKRRGMQEVEEIDRELGEETRGRERAEAEVLRLKGANAALETQMLEAATSHNLDLEAAATASTELNDRVDILQAALNDQDQAHGARAAAAQADEGDNVWGSIVESQSEVLIKHANALSAFVGTLTCTTCQEIMTDATTLPCGHSGCSNCLGDWLMRQRSCPVCRVMVPPQLSASTMKTSFALDGTIKVLKGIGLGDDSIA